MKPRHWFVMAVACVAVIAGIAFWTSLATVPQQPDDAGPRQPMRGRAHASASACDAETELRGGTADSGDPAGNPPPSVAPVTRNTAGDEVTLPLVFRGSGAADAALTAEQQLAVRKIQEDFAAATSRAGDEPSSPEYHECWIQAKNAADSRLHLILGRQGWLLYSQAQARAEYSESHGKRAIPPAR